MRFKEPPTLTTILTQKVSPNLARLVTQRIPIHSQKESKQKSVNLAAKLTSPRASTKLIKNKPRDVFTSSAMSRTATTGFQMGSQSMSLEHAVKEIIQRKMIKSHKNKYADLADKVR